MLVYEKYWTTCARSYRRIWICQQDRVNVSVKLVRTFEFRLKRDLWKYCWVLEILLLDDTMYKAHESTEDLYRERLILLCLGIPTLFCFARFKGKWTPDKILSLLCVIVNRSYIWTSCNNTCRYKQTNVLSRTAIITSHYSESYSRIVSVESSSSIERATITTVIHYSCTCTYSDFNIHWLLQFY